jgi:uncharacterized membrane protein
MHALNHHIGKDGFRLRGREMSRIDGFSDVVFGFALTLIVVSLEVPKTYHELHELLIGFLPFAICFVFLIMVWWSHFRFFRRFGLHDFGTIVINSVLLFFVLFFVYPLKFLFTIFVRQFSDDAMTEIFHSVYEPREMMLVYCLGFAAVYLSLTALYVNAYRLRDELHLNALERTLTRTYIWDYAGVSSIALLAALTTMLLPVRHASWAGFVFFAIGIFKTFHGSITGPHIRRAAELVPEHERETLPTHEHPLH